MCGGESVIGLRTYNQSNCIRELLSLSVPVLITYIGGSNSRMDVASLRGERGRAEIRSGNVGFVLIRGSEKEAAAMKGLAGIKVFHQYKEQLI